MIPAQAVPWPTTSTGSSSTTVASSPSSSTRTLSPERARRPPGGRPRPPSRRSRRVTPAPSAVAERPRRDRVARTGRARREAGPVVGGERLAPGRQRAVAGGDRPVTARPAPRPRVAALGPPDEDRRAARARGRAGRDRRPGAGRSRRRAPTARRPRRAPSIATASATIASTSTARRRRRLAGRAPSAAIAGSADASRLAVSRSTRLARIATVAWRAKTAASSMSRRSNAACAALVEDLEDADRALVVDERHGDERPRHVAGLLGGRPAEPGVARDVRQRERLAGREHVAGDALVRPDRQPDDALALLAGRDLEDEPVRRRVVERDRRRLGVEQRDRRLDDRAQDGASPPAGASRRPASTRRAIARSASSARAAVASSMDRPVVGSVGSPPAGRSPLDRARQPLRRRGRRARRARAGRGPASARSASSRFTDWREPPIIPASSDWVYGQAIRIAPSGSGCALAGEPQDPRREPAGQVEEVEVLDVAGQAADLRRERREERPPQLRLGVDQRRGTRRDGGRASRSARSRRSSPSAARRRGSPARRRTRPGRGSRRSPARRPRRDGRTTLTEPLATMNSASPGSPWWKIVSPLRKRRTRRTADEGVDGGLVGVAEQPAAAERLVAPSDLAEHGHQRPPAAAATTDSGHRTRCERVVGGRRRRILRSWTPSPARHAARRTQPGSAVRVLRDRRSPRSPRRSSARTAARRTPRSSGSAASAAPRSRPRRATPPAAALDDGRRRTAGRRRPSLPRHRSLPSLPPPEVRKLVTLVFTDLKDSTALTGSIDAEAMNEIKARYFSSMAVEIERHGGKVEKNIGDAIMAVFGRDPGPRGRRAPRRPAPRPACVDTLARPQRGVREVLRRPDRRSGPASTPARSSRTPTSTRP